MLRQRLGRKRSRDWRKTRNMSMSRAKNRNKIWRREKEKRRIVASFIPIRSE